MIDTSDHCPAGRWNRDRPHVCEKGHCSGGGAIRCMWTTSSPRPVIRSTSPERAAWSGSSARRVVVASPTVTWQSSFLARSAEPAWRMEVISYVCVCIGSGLAVCLGLRTASVPNGEVSVITHSGVTRDSRGTQGAISGHRCDAWRSRAVDLNFITSDLPSLYYGHRSGL